MRRRLTFLIAAASIVSGAFASTPATAYCTVNLGNCIGGNCTVNTGDCTQGGRCTVNTGRCRAGGCPINTGLCVPGTAESADGSFCGFTSTNDPSGQVIQDPNLQTGEINAGPIVVVSQDGGTVSEVTITCTIQINDPNNPSIGGTSRTSTFDGNVGVLADTITYTAAPGDYVFVCTSISWNSSSGHTEWYVDHDADDPTTGYVGEPGNQCGTPGTSVEA